MGAAVAVGACTHWERLKIPLSRGVDRRIRDKETVRIDKQVYVKVPNPKARPGEPSSQYRYIPVNEYLLNPESYENIVPSTPMPQEDVWRPVEVDVALNSGRQEPDSRASMEASPHFKKRLMIVPFQDLTDDSHKALSDLVMQKLASQIQAKSDQVIFLTPNVVAQTLKARGIVSEPFTSAEVMRLAGELYNIHAIVTGTIDHVFLSSTESEVKGKGKTAYAIVEIRTQLVDPESGRVQREWKLTNPIFDSEGKGDFSKEKAQLKAVELITSELGENIIGELEKLAWYTTIASVDGNRVYISAGRLSGVQVGDMFSVYPETSRADPKGEIRVSDLFGIDASVADITKGKSFRVNDLVRPVFQ
jgi:hypothetical protein